MVISRPLHSVLSAHVAMPTILSTFSPPLILRPACVQTVTPALLRRINISVDESECLELPDGDFLELEWYLPTEASSKDALVILSHGLEGSTKSGYIQGLVRILTHAGFTVLAWNMRGCGMQRNRLVSWYHSGQSSDLREVIHRAIQRFASFSVYLVGISIGGNILCKYLGEEGKNTHPSLKGAIAVSPPLDLRGSAEVLAQSSRYVYMQHLLKPLRARIYEKAKRFPGHFDLTGLTSIRTFHEFDSRYTAPLHGFASVDEYWDSSSGMQFLSKITIPTLIITALDDPFLSPGCYPTSKAEGLTNIVLETPKHGGHVGFITSLDFSTTWLEHRILEAVSGPYPGA